MASDAPKVFISHSHDSPEHTSRVRALADRLRADGVESWIDQYVQDPMRAGSVGCIAKLSKCQRSLKTGQ
jgi:SEFIR domain